MHSADSNGEPMITTLKITTVLAAVICVCMVGFVGAFGLKGDPEAEKLIAEPSFVDQLKEVITVARADSDEMSPLVREAQLFAKRINPPPPPKPPVVKKNATETVSKSDPIKAIEPRTPHRSSAKFEVIATCTYEDDPDKSMALLKLPAKGLKWVRVNEHVEHLVVAEVTDGSVVMSDNGRLLQPIAMTTKPSTIRSLLAEEGYTPAPTPMVYSPISTSKTPLRPSLPKGNAYVAPSGTRRPPISRSRTTPKPGGTPVSRQPRRYIPPKRTPPRAAPPSPQERKALLDGNISDIRGIMGRKDTTMPKDEQAEEQDDLSRLLQLLEKEREQIDQTPKKNAASAAKARQPE